MPLFREQSNQFATIVTVAATSGDGVGFGFTAAYVRIANDGPRTAFLNFQSTAGASTDDCALTCGEVLSGIQVAVSGFGIRATASGGSVRVLALGGNA